MAQDVLDATQSLGSFVVFQQLRNLRNRLQPHHTDKVVCDFMDRLDETLRTGCGSPSG